MATKYWRIIHDLVSYKQELHRITDAKFQPLIIEIKKYEIVPESDDENLPSHKDLATVLNYSIPKISKLLKELLNKLIYDFRRNPLKIKEVTHIIHIDYSYEEQNRIDKQRKERIYSEYTWVEVDLSRTPSLGDEIRLDFMRELGRFDHGTVHRIIHEIEGYKQIIYLEVHPYNSFYYKWINMKDEYERWERFKSNTSENSPTSI